MATTHTDRRRFFLATALTLLALPALWWASESGGAPNVATTGIAVSAAADAESASNSPTTTVTGTGQVADVPPVFLDGPSGHVGAGLSEIAVPANTDDRITTTATFRSNLASTTSCIAPGISNGERVTVVNLDNGRSVTCTATLAPSSAEQVLVMSSQLFAEIADPTDAPIPVELRR